MVPYNDSYQTCERTVAQLRLYSGEIRPAEVTGLLGIEPTESTEAGGLIISKETGRPRLTKYNAWFLSSENIVNSKDLRRHLDWLLDRLEACSEALHELQTRDGVQMQISCIWWTAHGGGGPVLWPSQMERMAHLNLECGFEFADYSGDE